MENQTSHTENLGELVAALIKVQRNLKSAPKAKKNPFYKSTYADLPGVWEMCRESLADNGLVVTQLVEGPKEDAQLVTMLIHTSNQWIKSKIPLLAVKQDPQAQGSAITYARRYGLMAVLGMCQDDEDDDGEAATHPPKDDAPRKSPEKKGELTPIEIEDYLKKWGQQKEMFRKFLAYVKDAKKMKTWREAVDAVKEDEEKTNKAFNSWLERQAA